MELKIPYGKKNQSINLPDKNLLAVLELSKSQKDANRVLKEGFSHPIGGESFVEFISDQDRENFFHMLKKYVFSPSKGLAEIEKNFKLGYHKTAKLLQVYQHNQIWAVTELNSDDLKKANILSFNTVQEALDQALKVKGSEAQILVSLDGPLVIPEIK